MKKSYLIITFLLVFFNANGQYTYINLSGGYEGISLTKAGFGGSTLTGLKSFSTSISLISRFKRHFGIGAKYSFNLGQKYEFSFSEAETSGIMGFNEKYISDPSNRYFAYLYDYDVSYKNIATLFGRVYFDKTLNFYSDISISYLKISETFEFYRPYRPASNLEFNYLPELPEVKIDYSEEYKVISPGIKIGLSPHINDHLYIDFNFGWDLLFLNNEGFEHVIPFRYSAGENWNEYVKFENQANGTKALFSIKLGFGYYF